MDITEARAHERLLRDQLRARIEGIIARASPEHRDIWRAAFAHPLAQLDEAQARDDEIAADMLNDVEIGGSAEL